MRRFEVYLDRKIPGVGPETCIVEMPDSATDSECEEACRESLDGLIGNELYSGWDELPPEKPASKSKTRKR